MKMLNVYQILLVKFHLVQLKVNVYLIVLFVNLNVTNVMLLIKH